MTCPMCDRDKDIERRPLTDGVFVFCCERCVTGVLRTFAAHDPALEDAGVA